MIMYVFSVFFVQIIFLLASFFIPPHLGNLLQFKEIYRCYRVVNIIVQIVCIIANCAMAFIKIELMKYLLAAQVVLGGIVVFVFDFCGGIKHKKELTRILIEDDFVPSQPKEIKRYILSNYGWLYDEKEINKCIFNVIKDQQTIK